MRVARSTELSSRTSRAPALQVGKPSRAEQQTAVARRLSAATTLGPLAGPDAGVIGVRGEEELELSAVLDTGGYNGPLTCRCALVGAARAAP